MLERDKELQELLDELLTNKLFNDPENRQIAITMIEDIYNTGKARGIYDILTFFDDTLLNIHLAYQFGPPTSKSIH